MKYEKDEIITTTTPQINRCRKCFKKYYVLRGCDCKRLKETDKQKEGLK